MHPHAKELRTKSFPSMVEGLRVSSMFLLRTLPPTPSHHHHYSLVLLSLITPQTQFYVLLKKNLRQCNQDNSMKSGEPAKGRSRPSSSSPTALPSVDTKGMKSL